MAGAQGPAADPNSLMMIYLLIAAGVVVFWRVVVRLLIAMAVLMVILGAFEFYRFMH
jgi:hypothetical protein